jgi:ribosomal-protein-alanine N-acetyltransferase
MVTVSGIIWGAFKSGYLGYKLDQSAVGRGLMREALAAVIRHLFETAGLHRVEANIMPRNQRSLQVVKSLGFVNEGLARDYLQINGVWEDHLHMVLLSKEQTSLV